MTLLKSGDILLVTKAALRCNKPLPTIAQPGIARACQALLQTRFAGDHSHHENGTLTSGKHTGEKVRWDTPGSNAYLDHLHKHDPPHTDLSNAGVGQLKLPESQLPDFYPVTAEDWIRSARKYGIPIEEYQPIKDDGIGFGDYPDFPAVHHASRDHWKTYDNPTAMHDWGHVYHINEEFCEGNRADIYSEPPQPVWYMALVAVGFIGGVFGFLWITRDWKYGAVASPVQYPYGWDRKNFRFNPDKAEVIYAYPKEAPTYN